MNDENARMPEPESEPMMPEPENSQSFPPVHSWNEREAGDAFRREKVREKILRFTQAEAFRWIFRLFLASVVLSVLNLFLGNDPSAAEYDGYRIRTEGLAFLPSLAGVAISALGGYGLWRIGKMGRSGKPDFRGFRALRIYVAIVRFLGILLTGSLGILALAFLFSVPVAGFLLLMGFLLLCLLLRLYKLAKNFLQDLEWVETDPDSDIVPDPRDLGSFAQAFAILSTLLIPGILVANLNPGLLADYWEWNVWNVISGILSGGLGSAQLFLTWHLLKEYRKEPLPEMPIPPARP